MILTWLNHDWLALLLLLWCFHYIADYPLQGDFLAVQKNPYLPEEKRYAPWKEAMRAHCAIHGLFVGILTGSVLLGLLEALVHTFIDVFKCAGIFGYRTDQYLHLGFKLLWTAVAYYCFTHSITLY
ncbi:hypothetical protein EVB68_052 [Rhizobium phage RHph_Y2_6]|uniref:DUF3307 domain-containing protein n=1 Tax=Rhizobium phage RHph_Y2_6 TaxID=2509576 RepID=A0A7S5RB61_9CAUD|nr:membrane protein [Rhizobium phage RHph_Y2_6]QIG68789.1 hypothetical protein EVB68_052 [Rhizobium phage RHph_Y2_6]